MWVKNLERDGGLKASENDIEQLLESPAKPLTNEDLIESKQWTNEDEKASNTNGNMLVMKMVWIPNT